MGASIYIGLRQGPGRTLLIGIDPSLSPRCVFDDTRAAFSHNFNADLQLTQALLLYRSEDPGTPGAHQKRLDKLLAEVVGPEERSALEYVKQAVKVKASRDWDRWLSSNRATSALLELGIYTSVEKTAFFRTRVEKVRNKVKLTIDATIGETVTKGQRMFLARFVIPDWRREVRVRNDSELPPVFHDFCRA